MLLTNKLAPLACGSGGDARDRVSLPDGYRLTGRMPLDRSAVTPKIS